MAEEPKIRNAFVVTPEGETTEREMPQHIVPLVDSLEKLHGALRRNKEARS
jgi:hypothetical protein